jgi:uncharacterized protein YyaL (SSP411 family)
MPNRLAQERSPYLRQHATNPVDWYPWCAEAFERARQEDKPIFLSIGYSACHWCHVMERESFADPEVAQVLNRAYISIKVDREERPDIDAFYMRVCQALTGHGGWPLTIIMTPDKQPFFAATYLPKRARFGRPGLVELLEHIAHLWQTRRQELLEYAAQITAALAPSKSNAQSSPELAERATQELLQQWDRQHGGFGAAPKFPMAPQLLFLLFRFFQTGNPELLEACEHTLHAMRMGGIWDHVGFGFHRYATDERWRFPHFEKMLSDQALLALTYAEAYRITGRELWAQTVREILHYTDERLRAPYGAYYSAEDADSAGTEGAYYLWHDAELRQILTPEQYEFLCFAFGAEPQGNFADTGANVLFQTAPWDSIAERFGMSPPQAQQYWEQIRQRLLQYCLRRIPPLRDEKVLTDWNGLMLVALCTAGDALQAAEYHARARQAADWLLRVHRTPEGELLHSSFEGEPSIPGLLDDYAYLCWGMLALYRSTFEPRWLEAALSLGRALRERFWSPELAAFTLAPIHANELPTAVIESADGATPSGAGLAPVLFVQLYELTGQQHWIAWAEEALATLPDALERVPMAFPTLLMALERVRTPGTQLLLLSPQPDAQWESLRSVLQQAYLPDTTAAGASTVADWHALQELAPIWRFYSLPERATAYVCTQFACQEPVNTAEELRRLLLDKRALDRKGR